MITYIIIAVTVLISVLAFSNGEIFYKFRFNPYMALHSKQYYRFLTYGFLHADWVHLLINMFVLYSFGQLVEDYYKYIFDIKGGFYYVLLYVGAIAISVLPSFGKHKDNPGYNAVGASGAVSAVVFASILFEPLAKIYMFFIPIGIPAAVFGIIYLIYSAYMGKRGKDNIGHDAHFWGAIFGILFTIALKPKIVLYFISQITQLFS